MRERTTLVGTDRGARLAGIVLVNGALAVLLASIYLLVIALAPLAGIADDWRHIVATVVVAVSVVPLRGRLLTAANWLLRRRWQGSQELLRDVGGALSRALETDALQSLLVDDLPQRLRLTGATLWMLEPFDDRVFVALGASRDSVGAQLLANGESVRIVAAGGPRDVPRTAGSEWAVPFQSRGAVVVLPLRAGGKMVGIYGIGATAGGRSPSAYVADLVLTLGPAIASAIENVRAYAKIARLNEQLRALDQLKDEFIESVGHELRTPLTTMKLSLELLTAQPGVSPTIARIVGSSALQLHALVNRVLAFEDEARSAHARAGAASVLIDLDALVAGIAENYGELAWARGLDLVTRVEPGLGAWGVPARLDRALREVVDNAIRFSGQGVVTVSASFHDGLAVVSVIDQGPGIPEEERAQLFAPFYRGRGVRALAETPGAGLGLSIAQRDVEIIGGRIWLERSDADGSEICIAVPAVAAVDTGLDVDPAPAAVEANSDVLPEQERAVGA